MTKGQRTRARMLGAAAERIHRQGYHATGINDVLADAQAPRGSLYFHFPGGKEQLAAEAVQLAAEAVGGQLAARLAEAADPIDAVRSVIGLLGRQLEDSDYEKGCPVATVALELTAEQELLQQACASAYASWETTLVDLLRAGGHAEHEARERATVMLAAIEGALVLARAYRSRQPLRRVAAAVSTLLTGAA